MKYTVDFGNDKGIYTTYSFDEAKLYADKNADYTKKDIVIKDEHGKESARRRWQTKRDKNKKYEDIIPFGTYGDEYRDGFYDDWEIAEQLLTNRTNFKSWGITLLNKEEAEKERDKKKENEELYRVFLDEGYAMYFLATEDTLKNILTHHNISPISSEKWTEADLKESKSSLSGFFTSGCKAGEYKENL